MGTPNDKQRHVIPSVCEGAKKRFLLEFIPSLIEMTNRFSLCDPYAFARDILVLVAALRHGLVTKPGTG
jgi:hypothetical protein